MKTNFIKLVALVFCLSFLSTTAQAKPDNVDGVNVPSGRIPQEIKNNKYPRTYYPNTEKIGKEEMRIIACGTGMPTQTPSNAAACFLVELGNGESFLFDRASAPLSDCPVLSLTTPNLIKSLPATCTPTMSAILPPFGWAVG